MAKLPQLSFLLLYLTACSSQNVDSQSPPDPANPENNNPPVAAQSLDNTSGTPAAVLAAFAAKYPNETSPEWQRDRNDSYEAHFKQDGEKLRADFTATGTWIETERSVKWDDLPEAVQDAIKAEYKKDDIVELEYTDNAERGKFYDVELDPKGEKKFDIEYRADGSRVK